MGSLLGSGSLLTDESLPPIAPLSNVSAAYYDIDIAKGTVLTAPERG